MAIFEYKALNKQGKPLPFQQLSRRIQRKYDIEKMVKEIPVQINLFELIYYNGESWMQKPLKERWSKLNEVIKETRHFKLAEHRNKGFYLCTPTKRVNSRVWRKTWSHNVSLRNLWRTQQAKIKRSSRSSRAFW